MCSLAHLGWILRVLFEEKPPMFNVEICYHQRSKIIGSLILVSEERLVSGETYLVLICCASIKK
jgi:hypothetical protein